MGRGHVVCTELRLWPSFSMPHPWQQWCRDLERSRDSASICTCGWRATQRRRSSWRSCAEGLGTWGTCFSSACCVSVKALMSCCSFSGLSAGACMGASAWGKGMAMPGPAWGICIGMYMPPQGWQQKAAPRLAPPAPIMAGGRGVPWGMDGMPGIGIIGGMGPGPSIMGMGIICGMPMCAGMTANMGICCWGMYCMGCGSACEGEAECWATRRGALSGESLRASVTCMDRAPVVLVVVGESCVSMRGASRIIGRLPSCGAVAGGHVCASWICAESGGGLNGSAPGAWARRGKPSPGTVPGTKAVGS
mmetsp:Transcript_15547/g.52486  ORF Transcript_15547/g.52486 Transcript_15547/m.52486 type:complete len:306 (+) Transcript_15547:162-1079(+)